MNVFNLASMSDEQKAALLRRAEVDIDQHSAAVSAVIADIRANGDEAVLKYTAEFDGVTLDVSRLQATPADFEAAEARLDPAIKEVIEKSARNIRKVHEAQMPDEMVFVEVDKGILAGEKITPVSSVGLYVPRGKGAFPSVMLMLCTPAVIAGVEKIVVCTPPTPEGDVDDASLFAAQVCGVDTVYKVGGSQAIAALALGTETIPKVDKILGPGNPYVAAAKRLLQGIVNVGTPAGPSESIILCDDSTAPKIAALDLLIEAEHGPESSAFLVTHSKSLADAVVPLVGELLQDVPEPRKGFCESVFSNYGGVVLTPSLDDSVQFVNDFAPEHMELLVAEPMAVLPAIRHAGEILIGPYSPISFGNYCLGVNAILPTGGFARTYSCTTVFDFLKRTSIGYVTEEGYGTLEALAEPFAEHEGFPCHAMAIANRREVS